MINIKVAIPFVNFDKKLFHYEQIVAPYKTVEVEINFDFSTIFEFSAWFVKYSHAGVVVEMGLLGFTCCAQFYDIRHWNHAANRFQTEEEVRQEQIKHDEEQKLRESFARYREWLKK